MSEPVNLKAYFERIGFSGSIAPTLSTLETLHALHPATIPFENLDPLMGRPVRLDQKSLEKKLLAERRGGYCFEHNHLFWRVLLDLDYTVRGLGARVLWNRPEGTQRPISHMVLAVEISGSTYIADVGFGGMTLTAPLRLRNGAEQETPHETFRLTETDGTWRLDVAIGEDWRGVYAFDMTEFAEPDFAPINTALSTDAASRFRTSLIAGIAPKEGRHTLAGTRLGHYPVEGEASHVELDGLEAVKTALHDVFGIALPPAEELDPALATVLGLELPPPAPAD